jgi:DNA polymerase III sliding clamp (beta) subunit (PCNA family)
MKSKEVVFELNGEEGPGALRPAGDDSFVYVVMPIKSS